MTEAAPAMTRHRLPWIDRRYRPGFSLVPLRRHVAGGGVVAIPTESSYGLGVDPRSEVGVEAVFRLKGRARDRPLPVVVADLDQAEALGVKMHDRALREVRGMWPAPLTVLVEMKQPVPAMSGSDRLALRIPAHEGLRALLRELGHALTATSANLSGEAPVTRIEELKTLLADEEVWWYDDGELAGGRPSSMVNWDRSKQRLRVLRQGRFELEKLADQSGCPQPYVEIVVERRRK